MSKLENTLLKYANAVLDAKNGKTNPTLGELVDEPVQEVKNLMLEVIGEDIPVLGGRVINSANVDVQDPVETYAWGVNTEKNKLRQRVSEL